MTTPALTTAPSTTQSCLAAAHHLPAIYSQHQTAIAINAAGFRADGNLTMIVETQTV